MNPLGRSWGSLFAWLAVERRGGSPARGEDIFSGKLNPLFHLHCVHIDFAGLGQPRSGSGGHSRHLEDRKVEPSFENQPLNKAVRKQA